MNGPNGPIVYPPPDVTEKLRSSHPEVIAELESLRGLPPEDHARRLHEIYEAHQDLLPPPPVPRPPAGNEAPRP